MRGRPFDLAELITRVRPSGPEAGLASRSVPAAQMIPGTVGYIPQAIAYTIADRAGGTFLATVWAERLAVLLTSVLITALALSLMPGWARWTGVAVSLLPMAAYMRATLSPDAVVTAVTVLGIAAFLLREQDETILRGCHRLSRSQPAPTWRSSSRLTFASCC